VSVIFEENAVVFYSSLLFLIGVPRTASNLSCLCFQRVFPLLCTRTAANHRYKKYSIFIILTISLHNGDAAEPASKLFWYWNLCSLKHVGILFAWHSFCISLMTF